MKKIISYFAQRPCVTLSLCCLMVLCLIASSFFIEHILKFQPCTMCWWQRYTHWALFVITLIGGFVTSFRPLAKYFFLSLAGITSLISGGIGLYQSLGQRGFITLPEVCSGQNNTSDSMADFMTSLNTNTATNPACDDLGLTIFNLTLAEWNFVMMLTLTVCIIALLLQSIYLKRKHI